MRDGWDLRPSRGELSVLLGASALVGFAVGFVAGVAASVAIARSAR